MRWWTASCCTATKPPWRRTYAPFSTRALQRSSPHPSSRATTAERRWTARRSSWPRCGDVAMAGPNAERRVTRGPLVIAHAACKGHAPENTLAGIRAALALGCDAIEIDLQATADG